MTGKRRRSHGEGSVFPYRDGYAAVLDLGWGEGKRGRVTDLTGGPLLEDCGTALLSTGVVHDDLVDLIRPSSLWLPLAGRSANESDSA
jgi:hypothetical protein